MPAVRNVIKTAAGVPVQNVLVTIELGTLTEEGIFSQNLAFVDVDPLSTSDYAVDYTIDTAGFTQTDVNGAWQVTLYGNDAILNPVDSRYRITETYQGTQRIYYIRVPNASPSPNAAYWVGEILDNTATLFGATISLNNLSDVDPGLNPNSGQALVWNETLQKWVAGNVAVGGTVVPGDPTEDATANYPTVSPAPDTAIYTPLEHIDDTRPAIPGYHASDHEQARVEIIALADDLIEARGGAESPYPNFAAKMTALDETVNSIVTSAAVFWYQGTGSEFVNQPLTSNNTGFLPLLDNLVEIPAGSLNTGDTVTVKFDTIWKNYNTGATLTNLYKLAVNDGTTLTELNSNTLTQTTSAVNGFRTTSIDITFLVLDEGLRYFLRSYTTSQLTAISSLTNSWEASGTGNVPSANMAIGNGLFPVDFNNDITIDLTSRLSINSVAVGSTYSVQFLGGFAALTRVGVLS